MEYKCVIIKKENEEYRYIFYYGLECPNPREYYKNTRSFEDMKLERDLINCYKITEEDIIKLIGKI